MQIVEAGGARIPAIGLGTWQLTGRTCESIVAEAVHIGYRHLDTAQIYGNEAEVGAGLRSSGIDRDQVFVTTKVWPDNFRAADFQRSVDESLAKLRLDAVDLLLLHWPNSGVPLAETIRELVKVKRSGRARHIGVSNFTVALVEEAAALSDEPLVTNQIEVHPFLDQTKVIAACRKHGISVTAYCPIARGDAPRNATLAHVGKSHEKTAAQVSLRYLIQRGLIVIPRTSKPERLRENFEVFDFALSDAEMDEVHALGHSKRRLVNIGHAPAWD